MWPFDSAWKVGWTWTIVSTGYKQVKINVKRLDFTDQGIFGHLTTDNGFDCCTLERHDLKIPEGSYRVEFYDSPTKGRVPLLQNVPGRTMIEIHKGNWETASEGCILVGSARDGFAIDDSTTAFNGLMQALNGSDDMWITIS